MIYSFFQFLSDLEEWQLFGGDLHLRSRAGVSPLIGLIGPYGKITKAADLNPLPFGQSIGHGGEDRVDDGLGVLLGQAIQPFHELLNELKLGHFSPSPGKICNPTQFVLKNIPRTLLGCNLKNLKDILFLIAANRGWKESPFVIRLSPTGHFK